MIDRPAGDLLFPADFLLGSATAAHQVEGGLANDWTAFEMEPGVIDDGSVSGIACDQYRRYRQDLEDLASLGQNAYRFSIEWARVEPREGEFDHDALRHYVDEVRECRRLGLEPVLTLHHYTLPRWLAARGGLLAPEVERRFARYAAVCARLLGAEVRWWITLNEPVALAFLGYLLGIFPPRQRSQRRCFAALRALVRMHGAAYRALHDVAERDGWDIAVSVAHHERPLRPRHQATGLDRVASILPNHLLNRWFLRACTDGRLTAPVGVGQRVATAVRSLDYLGVNYYNDELVRFDLRRTDTAFASQFLDPDLPRSTFESTIDPPAFTRAVVALWREFRLPILITENGVADRNDELRPRFIIDHVVALHDAMRAGADIRGYLYWTSIDNFEWTRGYSQHFGLIAVDRQTMRRIPKPSAEVYATICRARGVPAALLATHS